MDLDDTFMDSRPKPPRPFRQTAPDRIEIREGGGCLSIFGIPFLAGGVFVALIGTQVIPVSNRNEVPAWAWPVIFLMGLVFVAAGGWLVFGRRWTSLDSGKGLVVKQAGLLVPLQKQQFQISDYDRVLLRFEEGDSDTADRYPVALQGKGGRPDLALSSATDYASSREQAGFIAGFLRLPLVDASTDHEVVVAPDQASPSADQVMPSAGLGDRAARPPFMRSQVEQSGGKVRIVVPGPGFRLHLLLGFVLPAAILGYLIPSLLEFFWKTHTPEYVQIFFVGFILLFFCLLPSIGTVNGIIRAIRGRTTVDASAAGITIEEQAAWRKRVTYLPAGEIFGLDYSAAQTAFSSITRMARERFSRSRPAAGASPITPGGPGWLRGLVRSKGVLVKCKKGIVAFGAGLPDDEVRYLCALVKRALAESKK
jgi:hypothetical protein